MGKRPFCVKGGEIIGNVPTLEELHNIIRNYILDDIIGPEWSSDNVRGATRQALYNMYSQVVGQLEYRGLWDASSGNYPEDPELGWYYVVSVAGEVGGVHYRIGDWIIWNGTSWDKLAGKADVDPIGIQKNYFGTGIKGDVYNRDYEISVANGDDFDMKGWFVANGNASTPNCLDRFFLGFDESGAVGGTSDIPVIEHTHGIRKESLGYEPGLEISSGVKDSGTFFSDSIETVGVSGVGINRPKYIKVIPIIKMG